MGLELNTIVFIPLILTEKTKMAREASIRYFLTQTLASVLIVVGGVSFFLNLYDLGNVIILIGLATKLGGAPFHRWILSIAECVE